MVKERNENLDFIKMIAMVLVVFCHFVTLPDGTYLGNAGMTLAWGGVPCFFMVSGYLMHDDGRKLNLERHLKKMAMAYVIFCIWRFIYFGVFFWLQDVECTVVDAIQYIFLFADPVGFNAGALWFMPAYIVMMLFAPISVFLFKGKKEGRQIFILIMIVLFIVGFLRTGLNFGFDVLAKAGGFQPVNFDSLKMVQPFGEYANVLFCFMFGGVLCKNQETIRAKTYKSVAWNLIFIVLVLIGMFGNMGVKYFYSGTFKWQGIYLINGYYRIFTLIMAVGIMLFGLSHWMNKVGCFLARFIGRETLGIYFIHYLLLLYASERLSQYYESYYSFSLNICKTIIALVVSALLTKLIGRIPVLKKLVKW